MYVQIIWENPMIGNFKDKSRRMHLNVEELKELICAGWEIGSHGVTHESLLRLDDADIEWQLKESKKILEEPFRSGNILCLPLWRYKPLH